MDSLEPGAAAVVVGATGGIGAALVMALLAQPGLARVVALSRSGRSPVEPGTDIAPGRLQCGTIDVTDGDSVVGAAERLARDLGAIPLRLVIVATGALHGDGLSPEKSYRALDADALMHSYRVNAVGPALVARSMLPLLAAPGRSLFAALSARVGSIGDNRAGGWHAYRASKAALNMILRNLAIETARRTPETLCVGLHPGTVDTGLSRPFQRGVAPDRLFTAADSASKLLAVLDSLDVSASGCVLDWDGKLVPP